MTTKTPQSPDKPTPIELTVDESHSGLRLDRLLAGSCPGLSRTQAAKAIKAGQATIDGKQASPGTLAKAGQKVSFLPPDASEPEPGPDQSAKLDIIYQDSDILVINKPAGLVSHPARGTSGATLAGALLAHDPNLASVGAQGRPGLVHRLDKDTSGVMAIARNQAAFDFLSHAFAERQVGKLYLAFVSGQIQGSGQIDAPIGRHPTLRHKMAAGVRDGRKSRSLYRVICKFPRTGLSLVSVTLLTGRTHQARVHLSSIGAPVLADPCYGKGLGPLAKSHPSLAPLLTRQFLHARRLAIPHPSGDTMTFRAPWPQDFLRLLEELRRLERETK